MGWVKTEKTNKLSKLGDIDFTTTAPVDGNALVYDETNDVWVPGEGGGSSGVELTQAEYDQLTQEEKNNGSIYKITDKAKIYCLDEAYHAVLEITSADYAQLTSDEKNNGTLYVITDEETTADDIPYSAGVSVADKLDNVPTFDTLTTSDNNKLLGVSVVDGDISVVAVDNSITDITSTYCTTSTGVTLEANDSSVYKQGKHIWGNLQFVIPSTTSQQVIASITSGFQPAKTIIGYAGYSGSKWSVDTIGSLYIGTNQNIACTVSVSGKTYVNIVIDYLTA